MYESYYGFTARPFQLMPDPRLVFKSRNHTRALSYLIYGMERREGLVVITGDVGTGKTLLLQTLLIQPHMQNLAIGRLAMANLDAAAVLPAVAGAFGIAARAQSKFEMLDSLVARLVSLRARGALLIIDEAQTCGVEALEELRVISNLQAEGKALVQIVLVGQTELRTLLSRPSMAHLRQRIVASYHLEPLASDEVPAYIEHRLEKVGWQRQKPRFGAGVYARINDWARGIPRRINLVMDRFLLYGFLEERIVLNIEDLETVISEFDEEFTDDNIALDDAPAVSASVVDDRTRHSLSALVDRVAGMERALRRQVGDERADELFALHQSSAEQQELVNALLRVERLENTLADAARRPNSDAAVSEPVPAPVEADTAPEPSTDTSRSVSDIDEAQLSWSASSGDSDDSALNRYFKRFGVSNE